MRFVTFDHLGEAHLGALIDDRVIHLSVSGGRLAAAGVLRSDLSRCPDDLLELIRSGAGALVAARAIEEAARAWLVRHVPVADDPLAGAVFDLSEVVLKTPLADPPLILGCLGNSPSSVRPLSVDRYPDHPTAFVRPSSCLIGPDEPVRLPGHPGDLFLGAELAIVLSADVSRATEDEARRSIFGYTMTNDLQIGYLEYHEIPRLAGDDIRFVDRLMASFYGKWWPGLAPTGPVVVTADEIPDPYDLPTTVSFAGTVLDRGHTCAMLFGPERVVTAFSRLTTLERGTLIHLGSMHEDAVTVSNAASVPAGSEIEIEIDRIGRLRNPLLPESGHEEPAQ